MSELAFSVDRKMPLKSKFGGSFWSKLLAGERSVGVRRAEVVEIGERSGDVGE